MKKSVTIKEISDQLHIPRTTLNEWKQQYSDFLPSTGEGRSKRFIDPDAIEVFQTIAKLKQSDHSTEEISRLLQSTTPMMHQIDHQEPVPFLNALDRIAAEMKKTNELKEKELQIRTQEIELQRQFMNQVVDRLEKRNDDVDQAIHVLKEAQAQAAASSLGKAKRWWPFKKK